MRVTLPRDACAAAPFIPGGRRTLAISSSSSSSSSPIIFRVNSFNRMCIAESRHRSLRLPASPQICALASARAHALLTGHINFVIKSSRIITENRISWASRSERQFHIMTRLLKANYGAFYRRIDRAADSTRQHRQPPFT